MRSDWSKVELVRFSYSLCSSKSQSFYYTRHITRQANNELAGPISLIYSSAKT